MRRSTTAAAAVGSRHAMLPLGGFPRRRSERTDLKDSIRFAVSRGGASERLQWTIVAANAASIVLLRTPLWLYAHRYDRDIVRNPRPGNTRDARDRIDRSL